MREVSLKLDARGWRDIYWCWITNEPFFNEYRDEGGERKLYCPNCKLIVGGTGGYLEDSHEFLRHLTVNK